MKVVCCSFVQFQVVVVGSLEDLKSVCLFVSLFNCCTLLFVRQLFVLICHGRYGRTVLGCGAPFSSVQ